MINKSNQLIQLARVNGQNPGGPVQAVALGEISQQKHNFVYKDDDAGHTADDINSNHAFRPYRKSCQKKQQ